MPQHGQPSPARNQQICAEKDKRASMARHQIRSVIDAVKAAGKPYINVEVSDADHGFFCDARPSYNPVAAKEAWSLVASFLEAHVKKSEERTQSAR